MAMALEISNKHHRIVDVNPDGVKDYMEKLLLQIYEYFDEQDLIDVTFKLSNPNVLITAHRLILDAASPYFKELFKSDKGVCPLIEINDIDSDTFGRLITFCYTGQTLATINNVDQMLKAAKGLQLEDVVANCVEFIIDNMTDYTLRRAYALESETQSTLLSQKIFEYEIKNFMEVIQSPEFLYFDADKFQRILESDDLNVTCEKYVFEAVKDWYEHDAAVRKQQLPDLIGCLRLTQFDINYINTNILPLPGCRILALEAITWVNVPSMRAAMPLKRARLRKRQSEYLTEPTLFALNLLGNTGALYQYDKAEHLWYRFYDIEKVADKIRVIYMNEQLILIGGCRNGTSIDEVGSWNCKTKTFKQMPSMNQRRHDHSVVLLNDKIYAIGGRREDCDARVDLSFFSFGAGDVALKSVETYSVSNGWKPINSMITPRYAAAAVTLNGKIYVMGGCNKNKLKSVEQYNPATGCWTQCADMNRACSYPGSAVHNGQIFVVGGSDTFDCSVVERYDPQRNEWTKVCSLRIGRYASGCISFDNQLWVIGGNSKNCISVYDDQNDEWIEKIPILAEGEYYCFTAPNALLQSE